MDEISLAMCNVICFLITSDHSCVLFIVNNWISQRPFRREEKMTTTVSGTQTAKAAKGAKSAKKALDTSDVPVSAESVGSRWSVQDLDHLAGLIALIAMGQAVHAAKIIEDLSPASSEVTPEALTQAAKKQLQIVGTTQHGIHLAGVVMAFCSRPFPG
jgi:hypothetical protein